MTREDALSRTVLLCRDFLSVEEATDDDIVEALCSATVCIVADTANLSTAAGQAATITLAAQVLGYGCQLRLVMPDVPVIGYQPPLRTERIRDGLRDLAEDLIPGGRAFISDEAADGDFVLIIGSTRWSGTSCRVWRLGGSRWTGMLAQAESTVPIWPDAFPMGALAAATLGAAEPFKAILTELLCRKKVARSYDELLAARNATVTLADEHLASDPLEGGDIDIVSGGAITNAALHALLRIPNLRAKARVFEPENLDVSNLNRYALARRSRVRDLKVDMICEWQRPGFAITQMPLRFDEAALPAAMPLAQTIIMGTDDIPSRWFVQQQRPSWLGVGATIHFSGVVSEHFDAESCAGCLHPEDDDVNQPIATVSFVSYWAGLWLATRLVRYICNARLTGDRQAVEIAALRLDSPRGAWFHPINRSHRCPLNCEQTFLT